MSWTEMHDFNAPLVWILLHKLVEQLVLMFPSTYAISCDSFIDNYNKSKDFTSLRVFIQFYIKEEKLEREFFVLKVYLH